MPKMTKRQFEEMFREDVLPHVIDQYEQDGSPDRPARREAWNNTVDSYIRDRELPEAAGNWDHPRWLETWSPGRRHHAAMAGGKKSPAQLDAEINQILTHGVDTVQPRRLAGQPLLTRRPAPAPHGVDTILPRRLAGQPLPQRPAPAPHGASTVMPRRLAGQPPPTQHPAPAPHGVDTVKPRRSTGTSHARKKIGWHKGETALFWTGVQGWTPVKIRAITAAGNPQIAHPVTGKLMVVQAEASLEKPSSVRSRSR